MRHRERSTPPRRARAHERPSVGPDGIGPKVLAYHRSTFNDQHAHCHPRFTPDGHHVLYTSDATSYSNIYLVEVGDFDDLPDLESVAS